MQQLTCCWFRPLCDPACSLVELIVLNLGLQAKVINVEIL